MVEVQYINKEPLGGYLGRFFPSIGTVFVRADLPPRVKSHIADHMIYHHKHYDREQKRGVSEFRATVVTGAKDPRGFMATIGFNLTRERVKFYGDLFRGKVPEPPIDTTIKLARRSKITS